MKVCVKICSLVIGFWMLAVLLTACREVTEGRFVETDITPDTEEEILAVFTDNDILMAYSKGLSSVYRSTDKGENWEREDGPKLAAGTASKDEVERLTRALDGTLVFYRWDDYDNTLIKVTPEGETIKQPLEGFDDAVEAGKEVYISHLDFISADQLLVTYYIKEYMDKETEAEETVFSDFDYELQWQAGTYDIETGKRVHQYNDRYTYGSVYANAEKVYIMDNIGEIHGFEVSTANQVFEMPSLEEVDMNDGSNTHFSLLGDDESKAYAVNGKKLWEIDMENFKTELVMDSSYYQFGNTAAVLEDMVCLGEQDFLIHLSAEEGTRLYHYTYDEKSKIDEQKQLHIWTLNESETIRSAMREYMAVYPDASITLEVAMSESSAATENDALKDLNTRMLAGEGPDILLLDGSSKDTYVENNLLLDLNGKIELDDVFQPARDEYSREEGTYYFPARFSMPLIVWNDESPKEIVDFEDFITTMIEENTEEAAPEELVAIPKEQRNSIRFFNIDDLFEVLWKTGQTEVIKNGGLDTESLRKLLEDTEKILAGIHTGTLNYYSIQLETRRVTLDEGPNRYLAKQAHYGAYIAEDLLSIALMDVWDSDYGSFTGMAEGVWIPSDFVGINAQTKAKDAAAEFVQFMFSDNAQAALANGIPITYSGAELQQQLVQGEGIAAELDLEKLVGQMKTPVETELEIDNMITDTVSRLGKNLIDLEGAVKEIEEGVRKYYAEK